MSSTNNRQKRDLERLTGRRRDREQRAVLWSDAEVLAEMILKAIEKNKKLSDNLFKKIPITALNTNPAIREVNQLIDQTNEFIANEAARLDNQLVAERTITDSQIETVNVLIDEAEADIQTEIVARTDGDTAIANDLSIVTARVAQAEADIVTEQIARADQDTALSQDISTVSANLGAAEAQVSQVASAIVNIESYQAATYSLRVDAGDAQGSLELVAADDPINGPASAVRIRADNILLDGTVLAHHIDTASLAADSAFIDDLTSNTAFIQDLTASTAFISNLTVDTLSIVGEAVTTEKLANQAATDFGASTSSNPGSINAVAFCKSGADIWCQIVVYYRGSSSNPDAISTHELELYVNGSKRQGVDVIIQGGQPFAAYDTAVLSWYGTAGGSSNHSLTLQVDNVNGNNAAGIQFYSIVATILTRVK